MNGTNEVNTLRYAERILAVRLGDLGDVVLMTPAIHALRRAAPRARIALWTSPAGAEVADLVPDIDEVIASDVPWLDPWRRLPRSAARERALIEQLRRGRYDAAVIFTTGRQSPLPAAYACYLADIAVRIAATDDDAGSLLTLRPRAPERVMHEVDRALDLVAAAGIGAAGLDLVLDVPTASRERAQEIIPDDALTVVVHPECSMPAGAYPRVLCAQVVALLALKDARILVTGTPDERKFVGDLLGAVPAFVRSRCASLAGELSVGELVAVIERADVLVTNDPGPMHVAAAVKTPVVAIFALTDTPEQCGPWRVLHRLLERDEPYQVAQAALDLARGHAQPDRAHAALPPRGTQRAPTDGMIDGQGDRRRDDEPFAEPQQTDALEAVEEAEPYFPPTDPVVTEGERGTEVLGGFEATSMHDDRGVGVARSGGVPDEALAGAVRRELSEDATTTDLELEVAVADGIATLRGRVPDLVDTDNALAVAGRVSGVVDVVDEIEVEETV